MDKKKTVVLGVVGAASALGLGWLLSRVIGGNGGNGGGNGGGDSCGAGYHWDEALGGCVPDDIPIDPILDMDPDAIWARANEVCSDPDNLGRPPVDVVGVKLNIVTPGQAQPVKNLFWWNREWLTRPNSVALQLVSGYQAYRSQNPDASGCVVTTHCDNYLSGEPWCNYEERPAGVSGQLVRQRGLSDADGYWSQMFEWQGAWVPVGWDMMSPYPQQGITENTDYSPRKIFNRWPDPTFADAFKSQDGVRVDYVDIGSAEVTLLSDVDYIIPPDMMIFEVYVDHPGDAKRIPQLYGAPNIPGPPFIRGYWNGSDSNRSTWINLRAGVPKKITVSLRAYIYGAYTAEMYGGDRQVAAGAYQGGPIAGAYSCRVRFGFPKACVMLYNRDWYYPPTTEQDYYTEDLGVYDKIASFSIGQNELLHDNLKFWHIRPMACSCFESVQFYHPEGQQTVATPKGFTIVYPFTVMV